MKHLFWDILLLLFGWVVEFQSSMSFFFFLFRVAVNICALSAFVFTLCSILQLVCGFFVLAFIGCLGQLACSSTNSDHLWDLELTTWKTPIGTEVWNVWVSWDLTLWFLGASPLVVVSCPWGYDFVVFGLFSLQIEDRKDAFGGNLWLRDVSWMDCDSNLIPVFGNEVHRRSRNLQR